ILLVIDFLSPFNLSRFFGGQLAATYNAVTTPIQPYTYWQFEGTPWNTPTIGSSSFTDGTSCSFVQTANGPVGKYLNYTSNSGCYQNIGKTPSSPSTSFAVEFIWKPSDILVSNFITTTDNSFSVLFESPVASTSVPYIKFSTTGTTGTNSVSDDFQIALDGVGPKSPAYYNDGNWHHMVFKYSNGVKEVWVDGLLPSGFSKTVPNTNKIKSSNGDIKFFGNSTAERRYIGAIDQFALWSNDLPGNLIYQQYLDSIVNGQSYSWVTNITNTPNPQAVSASFDPLDYLPGAQLGTSPYTTYSTTPPTVLNQLQSVPLPRYKTGHTLLRNFNWNDLDYLAHFTPTDFTYTHSAAQVQAGVAIAGEMASKWNYYLDLAPSLTSSNLDTGVSGVPGLISYSNSNPTLPTQLVILRAQLSGSSTCGGGSNTPCLKYQGFGNQYYLQNASGQFIDINGNVTTSKVWRPLSSQFSQYTPDGNAMKSMVNSVVSQLTKPVPKIDLISENGEILVKYETSALNSDPAVSSAISSSGMDAQTYVAKMVSDMANQTYRDVILSIQGLAGSKYLEYAVDGYEEATRFKWSEARKMQSPINGQYYATPDFYPRWPSNWRSKISAWNGMYFIQKVMGRQQATGDKFFGAYMSPGWDLKAELNISPGQWLGLSKNINNMGSEFFHTGYFNRVGTNEDGWPAQKIWQNMIPSYSQAVFSYVDSFYKNSNIMTGDLPLDYASSSTTPGYAFKSGRMDAFTTIRKDNSANKYLIVSNLNQYTNMDGAVPEIAPVSISLSGESLKFNSRRQGSTYIYDKTGATPVF
ncbi:MAG TPA: hypothetical protein PK886_03050, partial [Candidatus Paceibacterota bacterium]|nr:hypothetical protein [Candidatus Paceibacterota bacterium]